MDVDAIAHSSAGSAHAKAVMSVHTIGEEKQKILVVDGFYGDVEPLISDASNGYSLTTSTSADSRFKKIPNDYYPGVRKNAPKDYSQFLREAYLDKIFRVFGVSPNEHGTETVGDGAISNVKVTTYFSIATTPPEKLIPIQRIPHFDTSDPCQFAIVHYLCSSKYGGTAFYRHRRTHYETVSPNRADHYVKNLKREATSIGLPSPGYINGDTPLFERIGIVDASMDRAVIYKSNLLHSGCINPAAGLSANPKLGRLTLNTLISFKSISKNALFL